MGVEAYRICGVGLTVWDVVAFGSRSRWDCFIQDPQGRCRCVLHTCDAMTTHLTTARPRYIMHKWGWKHESNHFKSGPSE